MEPRHLTPEDSVDHLNVSVRVRAAIETLGCRTIRDVLQHPRGDWMSLRNFGRESWKDLQAALSMPSEEERQVHALKQELEKTKQELKATRLTVPKQELETAMLDGKAVFQPVAASKRHPADDVLDLAVGIVRAVQQHRLLKDKSSKQEALNRIQAMKAHFPRISRKETVRLSHCLVHVSSMSLRHALGMSVVLPDEQTIPPAPRVRKVNGRIQKVVVQPQPEGSPKVVDVVEVARDFFVKPKPIADFFQSAEAKGWQVLPGFTHPHDVLRTVLKASPEFRHKKENNVLLFCLKKRRKAKTSM